MDDKDSILPKGTVDEIYKELEEYKKLKKQVKEKGGE